MAKLKEDVFAKTMAMCLESKKRKAPAGKAAPKSRKMTESAKRRRQLRESEDEETYGIDEELLTEEEDEDVDSYMDDISDTMVLVDPELDVDDLESAADDLQDLVDGTPDGEIPFLDDYIGDDAYTCPICANTFISEDPMEDGEECPVCGDFPSKFIIVGGIEEPEAVSENDDEDLDIDEPEEDLEMEEPEEEEEEKEESFRRRKAPSRTRTASKKPTARKPVKKESKFSLDETTFNPFLTKFIQENYKNARSMKVVSANLSGAKLSLECKLTFKTGTVKPVTLRVENFKPARQMKLAATEQSFFKIESKRGAKVAPFIFTTKMEKNIITCEGLKYKFVTKAKNENKRYEVYGDLIVESTSRRAPAKQLPAKRKAPASRRRI